MENETKKYSISFRFIVKNPDKVDIDLIILDLEYADLNIDKIKDIIGRYVWEQYGLTAAHVDILSINLLW